MCELSDVLEGGDVALDYEGYPAYIAIIQTIDTIISERLKQMKEADEYFSLLRELKE